MTRNAPKGKYGSSHYYLDRRPLHEIDEIVYEYDRKQFHRLVYVALLRVFLIRYLILYECADQGTYHNFYFKHLKNNNSAHLSFILIDH